MSALSKYNEALVNRPERGQGLHQHVMKIAMLGRIADIAPDVIVKDIGSIPKIKPREAEDAVAKAYKTTIETTLPPPPRYEPKYEGALDRWIKGESDCYMDLINASPTPLSDEPKDDARLLLETLYRPEEYLFIGSVYDKTVKPVEQWLKSSVDFPHIIPNPMTGEFAVTGAGSESRRCEATVADLRYAVCEMDGVPLNKQIAFWNRAVRKLPVVAVIHSASKSLHGWIKVDCGTDSEKWERDVKGWLFGTFGKMYGFDMACSNKARLSRMPSYMRDGISRQILLYLDGSLA